MYLSASGADPFDLSKWIYLGWCLGRSVRYQKSGRVKIRLSGYYYSAGKEYRFSATGIQDVLLKSAQLAAIEKSKVDILLVENQNSRIVFKGFSLLQVPVLGFDQKTPLQNKIEAIRFAGRTSQTLEYRQLSDYIGLNLAVY